MYGNLPSADILQNASNVVANALESAVVFNKPVVIKWHHQPLEAGQSYVPGYNPPPFSHLTIEGDGFGRVNVAGSGHNQRQWPVLDAQNRLMRDLAKVIENGGKLIVAEL